MMSALTAVLNNIMMDLRKKQEDRRTDDDHNHNGRWHDSPLINIKESNWITLRDTKEKIMNLLWVHQINTGNGRTHKERACIDPTTLVLVHRGLEKLMDDMRARVCFFYLYV